MSSYPEVDKQVRKMFQNVQAGRMNRADLLMDGYWLYRKFMSAQDAQNEIGAMVTTLEKYTPTNKTRKSSRHNFLTRDQQLEIRRLQGREWDALKTFGTAREKYDLAYRILRTERKLNVANSIMDNPAYSTAYNIFHFWTPEQGAAHDAINIRHYAPAHQRRGYWRQYKAHYGPDAAPREILAHYRTATNFHFAQADELEAHSTAYYRLRNHLDRWER